MRQTRRATPDLSSFVVDSGLLKGASPDQVRRKHVGQPKERLNGTTLTASASSPSLSGSSPSYRRTRMAPIDESSRVGPSRLADPAEHGPEPASPQEMAWHGMHSTDIRSTPSVLYPPQSSPTPRSCALFSGDARRAHFAGGGGEVPARCAQRARVPEARGGAAARAGGAGSAAACDRRDPGAQLGGGAGGGAQGARRRGGVGGGRGGRAGRGAWRAHGGAQVAQAAPAASGRRRGPEGHPKDGRGRSRRQGAARAAGSCACGGREGGTAALLAGEHAALFNTPGEGVARSLCAPRESP